MYVALAWFHETEQSFWLFFYSIFLLLKYCWAVLLQIGGTAENCVPTGSRQRRLPHLCGLKKSLHFKFTVKVQFKSEGGREEKNNNPEKRKILFASLQGGVLGRVIPKPSTELLPQAETKSHFQVPGEMLSCLVGSSCFIVNICWAVSYQWLGSGVVVCLSAVFGSGQQGWCERLMVKGGVQHFCRAVPVGEVAVPVFPWSSVEGEVPWGKQRG